MREEQIIINSKEFLPEPKKYVIKVSDLTAKTIHDAIAELYNNDKLYKQCEHYASCAHHNISDAVFIVARQLIVTDGDFEYSSRQ